MALEINVTRTEVTDRLCVARVRSVSISLSSVNFAIHKGTACWVGGGGMALPLRAAEYK